MCLETMDGRKVGSCRLFVAEARLRRLKVWKARKTMEENGRTQQKKVNPSSTGVGQKSSETMSCYMTGLQGRLLEV